MRRPLRHALAALLLVAGSALPLRAEYALQPGDQLEVSIAGLPDLSVAAAVDSEGMLDLAWIGAFRAEGQAVEDIEASARQAADGKILRQYNRDGQVYIIHVEGERLDVRQVGHRPVILTGDVALSGQIPFSPGMTIREAVALSGGILTMIDTALQAADPVRIIEWRGQLQQSAVTNADAVLRLWRIGAEIDEDWDATPPALADSVVPQATIDRLAEEQRALLRASERALNREATYYAAADQQAARRFALLTEQQTEQKAAAEFDMAEVERTRGLVERGLSPSAKLADIRRSATSSATQLLDIEEALSAAELARLRLAREYEQSQEQRRLDLLTERRQADADLRAAQIRITVLSQFLGVAETGDLTTAMPTPDYRAVIFRRTTEGVVSRTALKDDALEPGDLVEIELIPVPQDPYSL